MEEIWLPVVDFINSYEVSNLGRIRSLERMANNRQGLRPVKARILKQIVNSRGYLVVNLTKPGIRKQYMVHRIVLEAFCGKRPDGFDGCHNNGNKQDARICNLRWDTRSSNHQDKRLHGTAQIGERANNVKLTNAIVNDIRKSGISPIDAVRKYGLSKTNARRIVNGETWRHLL